MLRNKAVFLSSLLAKNEVVGRFTVTTHDNPAPEVACDLLS